MLRTGDLDPQYYENPSAFTYLVYATLHVLYGGGIPFDHMQGFLSRFEADATLAYEPARVLATVLCMLAVAGVFSAGRRLWGASAGVAAAAILAFAFLPVAYSRYAVTDTGVLLPVTVAIYGAIRCWEDGRARFFVLSGLAVGLAIGFKYTAGLLVAPLVLAAALRARHDRRAVGALALAGVLALAAFALTTPYFFLDLRVALDQLSQQSDAASVRKLGQGDGAPFPFYLRSLTWGLGLAGALAAAAGLASEARRDRVRALLLALFPVLLFLYLCTAGRHFARWLLPAYPVLALLGGVALARGAALVSRWPARRAAVLAALVLAVVAQPLAADVRTARMFGREDTRALMRAELLRTLPHDARVVVEPDIPGRYFDGRLTVGFKAPPRTMVVGGTPQRFILSLEPGRLDLYRREGYCTVVTMSTVQGRARRDGVAPALAYYARLARESRVVFRASPFKPGAPTPAFDFDWSTHLYYPSAYIRPGPEVVVHRLDGCRQRVGGRPAVALPPAGLPEPDPASLD